MSLSISSMGCSCPACPEAGLCAASCCCICAGLRSPLPLALSCRLGPPEGGVPEGDDSPGGVPGASASSEMAAADSELLREAMGWLEGGVTGRASLGRLGSAPCACMHIYHDLTLQGKFQGTSGG